MAGAMDRRSPMASSPLVDRIFPRSLTVPLQISQTRFRARISGSSPRPRGVDRRGNVTCPRARRASSHP